MKTESLVMRLLREIGLDSVAWSLRRIYCPVTSDALVLEVGSGGNPYFRANVLLDAYEATRERHWVPLVHDRPTVFGYAEKLPFADQSFDFIVASHVLEHSKDPVRFLAELQRVGKAGYIEVPDAFMERLNPYKDHRLEITDREGRLIITKKPDWCVDNELQSYYEPRVKYYMTKEFMRKRPFAFHVRYYWQNKINYVVTNPDVDLDWDAPQNSDQSRMRFHFSGLKSSVLRVTRGFLSQRKRNRDLDLLDLLRCPSCKAYLENLGDSQLACGGCEAHYDVRDGIPDMTRPIGE